jgi:pyruvate carboxylase
MDRALREFRIRGVASQPAVPRERHHHPLFRSGECTTRFIDTTPELFKFQRARPRHQAAAFLGEVAVNGNPEMKGRGAAAPAAARTCRSKPPLRPDPAPPPGHARPLKEMGAEKFAEWMRRTSSACCSPTRRCATPTSRCSPRACAPTTCWRSRRTTRACCRTVLAGMLGRRDLRRGAALPQGRPLGAPGPPARRRAQRAVPDAAARLQRRRLHQLCRQRRALLRAAGGEGGRRRLPRLRLAELGGQHARGDGRGARDRRAVRGGDLLHRRPVRSGAAEVQPEVLRRSGQAAGEGRRPHPRHQGHGRRLPPRAARELVRALKQEVGLPIHFHTHDTSGIAAASVLAAVEAGATPSTARSTR